MTVANPFKTGPGESKAYSNRHSSDMVSVLHGVQEAKCSGTAINSTPNSEQTQFEFTHPGLVYSPVARADVTRLEEPLHQNSPREDLQPSLTFPLPTKNQLNTGCARLGMKSLGEDVCELLRGAYPNQTQVSILTASWAKCFRMSICLARSRPLIMLLLHSNRALLSS